YLILILYLILLMILIFIFLMVTGGNKTVAQGGTVVLPCKLIDTLSQISWQRTTRGKPQNEHFFSILPTDGPKFVNGHDKRFEFIGIFDDNNGSLQFANVTLMDEGIYTCIFTLFPSGNHETEIPLNLLGMMFTVSIQMLPFNSFSCRRIR
uniref:Ig-like domain-containing protein n=1 Tax=Sparus aurata TaxID=8175 RepID=A0A671WBV8_SPAAU